jgi:hypothetical protein
MPHDLKGNLVQVGDKVLVPCVVESVCTGEEYCNVTLKTTEKMFPGEYPTSIVLNAKQVLKDSTEDAR